MDNGRNIPCASFRECDIARTIFCHTNASPIDIKCMADHSHFGRRIPCYAEVSRIVFDEKHPFVLCIAILKIHISFQVAVYFLSLII